ncbi:group II intron maturase-specific domain-containing protein [Candidatus Brocadia sinica]|uniref:RNA-directed DNA polymerase n=1 Tax=Candidatus Brocadia sinica JPN1 TaxID=1197129 RepID=A0ABQ0JVD6_9BACT|nr:group II intron maturase-specific domain-containing protein [Candidatus Brocadia sinica]GAN32414.1 RNA-directed DNA polymerase [Candidatus Brocadia sinica JPN1]GIK14039.1 MAG: hypothetical protein BroJett002_27460 [Candidatus Brocadia sinica]
MDINLYEATSTFTLVTTRIVAHAALRHFVDGLQKVTFPSPHAIQATWLPAFAMTGLAPVSRHYPSLGTLIDRLNPVIRGHVNYFRLGDVKKLDRSLDCWVRMRLRCFKFSRKWRTDNKRFPTHRFFKLGLLSFEREFLKVCAKS